MLFFQHDGVPCHYSRTVKDWLNANYVNRWIGRNGSIHWPATSPDLTVLNFNVWGRMKDIVYTKEIVNIGKLRGRIDAAALQIRAEMNNIVISQNFQKRALAY